MKDMDEFLRKHREFTKEFFTPHKREDFLITKIDRIYHVAGYQYNDGPKIKRKLMPNVKVELIRDFENKIDPNAIKVMLDKYHLGYVPKEYAIGLALKMDKGSFFDAWIENFNNKERKPFLKLAIHVIEI